MICPTCRGSGRVPDSSRGLTRRQREIFDYVRVYVAEHGYAPTLHEIGTRFAIGLSAVHEHLNNLVQKGRIARAPMEARGITVLVAA